MYYNTTNETGETLKKYLADTKTQREFFLSLFKRKSVVLISPSEALKIARVHGKNYLLTSIRRLFSDLSKEGILEKTNKKVIGIYGHPEHLWKY